MNMIQLIDLPEVWIIIVIMMNVLRWINGKSFDLRLKIKGALLLGAPEM